MAMFAILCAVAIVVGAFPSRATCEKQPVTKPTAADNDLYQQLLSRVQHIEQHGNEQQADINKRVQLLEQRDKEQQADINRLRTELQTERRRTSILERKLLELTTRGNKGNKKAGDEVARPQHLDTSSGSVKDIGGDKIARENEGKRHAMIRRQEDVPVVAFHATLKSSVQHVGVQQMVHFDNVITNIGSAYNPHFGSFVAPVAGVYVFHSTITGYDHHVLHVSIVKNNVSVANIYIRGVESYYANGSAMAVLHLNKGDDVAVRNNDADKGISDYSMFSGFLLHEDHTTESIVG